MDDNENLGSENEQGTANGDNPSFGRGIGGIIAGEVKREVKHEIFNTVVDFLGGLFSEED